MQVMPHKASRRPAAAGAIGKLYGALAGGLNNLRIAEKISGIAALLLVVMTLLMAMSIQSVRLQAKYQRSLATSAAAAINIGRVNSLIYAIMMESRGIYMTTDNAAAKPYVDALLKRNRELSDVVAEWEQTVDFIDEAQFAAFRHRIFQFIDFRNELAHRATTTGAVAAHQWAIENSGRALRTALNNDLEAFAKILAGRTSLVADLAEVNRMASWYLGLLGLTGLLLTVLTVVVIRRSVITPLSNIVRATDSIAAGNTGIVVPYVALPDEIGHLARAVENFRGATCRNLELQKLEITTALQRDAAAGQRDKLNDKYLETKWQLSAALNNMPHGLVMIDSKAKILMTNVQFRKMYELPTELIRADTTLADILTYRKEKGLFKGDIDQFLKAILGRIASGKPSISEFAIADGRVFRVSEQPMAGGGWVSTHEDFTEQRRAERILARTERFLATIIENVSEAIVAKDARDLRYTFVNKAAERLLGLPRAEIIGKSVRDLFPAEIAQLIEDKDRAMLAGDGGDELTVRTVDTPNNGRRLVAVRRLRIAGEAGESHIFLSMIEDRTDLADVADIAA